MTDSNESVLVPINTDLVVRLSERWSAPVQLRIHRREGSVWELEARDVPPDFNPKDAA